MYEPIHADVAQAGVERSCGDQGFQWNARSDERGKLVSSPEEYQLPNLNTRVQFPSPVQTFSDLLDLRDASLIRAVREAGHHLLPLDAYLRGLPIIPDDRFDPVQSAQIRAAERFLGDRGAWSDPHRFEPLHAPGLTRVRAIAAPRPFRNLVLFEEGGPVACIRTGVPFVAPEHRGRGLGALLVLISDINGDRFLCPVSYSEAGWRARRSAHALQVRIAQQGAGGAVEKETGAEAPVLSI